ncbi:MAG: retroviral-like aspartic protease family protein [Nitrospinae bacterium]|nr:retroviral-like aspartic protease family protein [Nitrospinota bacterium]MBF0634682.1 retroviral-like aspartic protease family protein [Nitrospinota bacterium]
MNFTRHAVVALITVAIYAVCSEAQTYTLTDGNGVTTYTDAPASNHAPHNSTTAEANAQVKSPGMDGSEKNDILYIAPLKGRGFSYCVDVSVNGSEGLNMLVDTGASFTMLTVSSARRLGITNLDELPRMPVSTAGGVAWIRLVELESVKVGGVEAVSVEGGVSDQIGEGLDGLLGASFLGEFVYQVDGPGGKLSLKSQRGTGANGVWENARRIEKRNRYMENIRRFTAIKASLDIGAPIDDPDFKKAAGFTGENAGKLIAFYTRMLNSLDRKTSAVGASTDRRVYP